MDKLIDKIIEEMKNSNSLTDDEEIVRLGLELMITKALFAIIIVIVGLLMECFFESVVFTLSFSILREYGGGYHAESRMKCFILSFLTLVVALGLIIFANNFQAITLPFLIMAIISAVYILCNAPIDTMSKRLDEGEIRVYGSRARLITAMLLLAAILLLFLGLNNLVFAVLTGIIMEAYLMLKGQIQNLKNGDEQ